VSAWESKSVESGRLGVVLAGAVLLARVSVGRVVFSVSASIVVVSHLSTKVEKEGVPVVRPHDSRDAGRSPGSWMRQVMAAVARRHRLWLRTVEVVGVLIMLTGVLCVLQSSLKPEISCPTGPTAAKTQSKLWFNDGAWWGILFDGSSEEYRIYRYDGAKEAWGDTGTLVDARNASRADALWDDGHLYVVSAGTQAGSKKDSARFLRYTYDPSTGRYSLDRGFPVTIAEGGTEAITLAKAATGELWATYTQDTKDGELRRVYVTHTRGSDASSWVEPFVPPLRGTTVSTDDVSSVVAFGSRIGLMWGNQYDESGKPGYYFAVHNDGEPDHAWRPDNPVIGARMVNDHINLKADSEGRVFAATKTRRDRIDRDLDAPYGVLWVRDREGTWTSHVFSRVGDFYTRSLVLIEQSRNDLYVFATSPTCSGGKIYYKSTDLDDISFEDGRGTPFIQGAGGLKIGDATSTKQNLSRDMEPMVVASSTSGRYYYNLLDPRDEEKLFPRGAPIADAGF
jgi:hypothetical protein